MEQIIIAEENRLASVKDSIDKYELDRGQQLSRHDLQLAELKRDRLESRDWREKDELSEKMVEHNIFDPARRLPPFETAASPFFAVIGIRDNDARIGKKEYVLGKQALTVANRAVIIDWRRAEISRLFYEYVQGDDYDEDIRGIERSGILETRRSVAIAAGALESIECPEGVFVRAETGWRAVAAGQAGSSLTKAAARDHRLVDIVALISAEQFRSITAADSGCVYLTGPAGSGKTTVAIHRLSYMKFNSPERFSTERCLILVFNRTLKNYVQKSAAELVGSTPVETFATWSIAALRQFGYNSLKFNMEVSQLSGLDHVKKRTGIEALLVAHVGTAAAKGPILRSLANFYASLPQELFKNPNEQERFCGYYREKLATDAEPELQFVDSGVLLRLCQLTGRPGEVVGAFKYYEHIIADEAQDFSLLELECIKAAMAKSGSMTLCADEKQKILGFVDATGLSSFKEKVLAGQLKQNSFTVGYRSAPEIMAVADTVAGRSTEPIKADGRVVRQLECQDQAAALTELRRVVEHYRSADPASLTAVICKTRSDIRTIHGALAGCAGLHAAGEIRFTPGIVVINAHQVKGLEFTNVIVWNPSAAAYGPADRNLLYVAISRACQQLVLIHWQQLSSLLPGLC